MQLSITMKLDNAAMREQDDDGQPNEIRSGNSVADVLDKLSSRFRDTFVDVGENGKLRDYNGNIIGTWEVTED